MENTLINPRTRELIDEEYNDNLQEYSDALEKVTTKILSNGICFSLIRYLILFSIVFVLPVQAQALTNTASSSTFVSSCSFLHQELPSY